MEQQVISVNGSYQAVGDWFASHQVKKLFLVCDHAFPMLKFSGYMDALKSPQVVRFDHFQPNPLYESVVEGVELFRREACDAILAVGGGSAMDVAKCVKLYSNMEPGTDYLRQAIVPNRVPLLAMPTTAGTGSEATRFAVIYRDGEKQSVSDVSCIPEAVIFDASALKTLPLYQKKSTMLDALCHAVESFWSVNSTQESRQLSADAIREIIANEASCLANEDGGNAAMLHAANTAGRAINITQTTAGHAMCYKLTSLYGVSHGHAAALCVRRLWPWMIAHTDRCIDPRGEEHLRRVFSELAAAMGAASPEEAAARFSDLFDALELSVPELQEEKLRILVTSVNPVRLKNNPVSLDGAMEELYRKILR